MKNKLLKYIVIIFLSIIFFKADTAYAQGGTIGVYPSTGNFKTGQPFTVDIKIDGGGKQFNVAKATVALSNFSVKNLVLGDCNFAFIKTPQFDSPSFIGGILGGSSSLCTVYTLTLVPIAAENANVNFINSSIIEPKTTKEIFSSAIDGSYTVSSSDSTNIPTPIPSSIFIPTPTKSNNISNQGQNNYDILVQVFDSADSPISGAEVSFNSGQKEVTNAEGTASFINIKQGMYQVDVTSGNKKFPATVMNFSGANHQMTFGIREQKTKTNILTWVIVLFVVIFLIFIGIVIYRKYIASNN